METSGARRFKMAWQPFISLCLLLAFSRVSALAQAIDWPTLGFSPVGTNLFRMPTYITHAHDGSQRLFVLEQPGRIWILQNTNRLVQPFLDISGRVTTFGAEEGLLGLAFPPGFSTNNYFYVDYTRSPDGAIVVSRFFLTATNSNVADPNSEQILLVIQKPFTLPGARFPNSTYDNHNAGQLAFGPDGYLYIGVGDGGSEGDPLRFYGQKTKTNLFSKILRIDVESEVSPYAIPPSNPFVSSNNFVPEAWAYGLRNPWRFSFDDLTGDLYIGDVGQNKYEEVDFQPASSSGGQNYGWSIMEGDSNYNIPGFTNFALVTLPAAVYSHASLPYFGQGAIIGGYVYRGPNVPRMNGMYFYGDFIAGWIWGLKEAGTNWQSQVLFNPPNVGTNFWISTFGEDDQGQLYLADYYAGKIYQIQDTHQIWPPYFSSAGGVINSNTVVISCLSTNAEIHYTTNGIDPTFSDPIITSGTSVTVATGITNKAMAYRSDLGTSAVVRAVFTLQVGTPVFIPAAGTSITSNTIVSISSVTPAVIIYYTTDGTTPTTNSPVYTGPFPVNGGITIEALGIASGYNSSVGATTYNAAQVATPFFIPAFGPITNGTLISMFCNTPNSTIYYTLDGSIPTTSSAVYTGPIAINGGTTVYAIAMATNYVNSPLEGVFYQLVQAATPVFAPSSGPITNGTPISITCATPGSTIYYTLDGTTPTTNSLVYTGPVSIEGGTTLNALAAANQYLNSGIQSTFYQLVQAATPTFSPASGPITMDTPITINCATPNSTIYYTVDGTTPTTNSTVYTGPFTIQAATTVSAFVVADQYLNSSAQSVFYQLEQTATPVFSPPSGPVTNGTPITINCATPGSTIFYTVDATMPTTNSAIYISPVIVNGATTLNAFATANYLLSSSVQSASYQIAQTPTPTFNPPNGPVSQGTTISLSCAAPGSIIFYTLDGSTPSTNSTIYSTPILVETDTTVSALARAPGELVSSVQSTFYALFQAAIPIFNPSQGPLTNQALISISCASSNATIYYTIDGSNPGPTNGFIYTGPLTLTNPMVLTAYASRSDLDSSYLQSTYYALFDFESTVVTTLAGNPIAGLSNGIGASASFSKPEGICIDKAGNLYVADTGNNVIRQISASGQVTTFAGTGVAGSQLGNTTNSQFSGPTSVTIDNTGNLYVADANNVRVCQISPNGTVAIFYHPSHLGRPALWQIEADPFGNIDVGYNPWKLSK